MQCFRHECYRLNRSAKKILTISVDFVSGTRFPDAGVAGAHPVYDTRMKARLHLNFFQHEASL
jgi:transposase